MHYYQHLKSTISAPILRATSKRHLKSTIMHYHQHLKSTKEQHYKSTILHIFSIITAYSSA